MGSLQASHEPPATAPRGASPNLAHRRAAGVTVQGNLCCAMTLAVLSHAPHALAQAPAPAPAPAPWTLTANAGVFSQYVFRGLTQTDARPAFQGGFDAATPGGFYAGTWGSNISWLTDSGIVQHGGGLEWDVYGGYRHAIDGDWGYDAGVYGYLYPGSDVPGATRPDTAELYVAGSWKWLSLKYSHAISNTFGIPDSKNSFYVDLSANVPLSDQWTLGAHVGRQHYAGSVNGIDHSDALDYTDWKLGITWSKSAWSVGAYYTDTDAKDAGYTIAGRNIGQATGTVFIQRTF